MRRISRHTIRTAASRITIARQCRTEIRGHASGESVPPLTSPESIDKQSFQFSQPAKPEAPAAPAKPEAPAAPAKPEAPAAPAKPEAPAAPAKPEAPAAPAKPEAPAAPAKPEAPAAPAKPEAPAAPAKPEAPAAPAKPEAPAASAKSLHNRVADGGFVGVGAHDRGRGRGSSVHGRGAPHQRDSGVTQRGHISPQAPAKLPGMQPRSQASPRPAPPRAPARPAPPLPPSQPKAPQMPASPSGSGAVEVAPSSSSSTKMSFDVLEAHLFSVDDAPPKGSPSDFPREDGKWDRDAVARAAAKHRAAKPARETRNTNDSLALHLDLEERPPSAAAKPIASPPEGGSNSALERGEVRSSRSESMSFEGVRDADGASESAVLAEMSKAFKADVDAHKLGADVDDKLRFDETGSNLVDKKNISAVQRDGRPAAASDASKFPESAVADGGLKSFPPPMKFPYKPPSPLEKPAFEVSLSPEGVAEVKLRLTPPTPLELVTHLNRALDAVQEIDLDKNAPEVRLVAITSAVLDFGFLGTTIGQVELSVAERLQLYDEKEALLHRIATLSRPTVAIVRSDAFGTGAEIALACSQRFITRNSRLGFPYFSMGLLPSCTTIIKLRKILGVQRTINEIGTLHRLTFAQQRRLQITNNPDQVLSTDRPLAEQLDTFEESGEERVLRFASRFLQGNTLKTFIRVAIARLPHRTVWNASVLATAENVNYSDALRECRASHFAAVSSTESKHMCFLERHLLQSWKCDVPLPEAPPPRICNLRRSGSTPQKAGVDGEALAKERIDHSADVFFMDASGADTVETVSSIIASRAVESDGDVSREAADRVRAKQSPAFVFFGASHQLSEVLTMAKEAAIVTSASAVPRFCIGSLVEVRKASPSVSNETLASAVAALVADGNPFVITHGRSSAVDSLLVALTSEAARIARQWGEGGIVAVDSTAGKVGYTVSPFPLADTFGLERLEHAIASYHGDAQQDISPLTIHAAAQRMVNIGFRGRHVPSARATAAAASAEAQRPHARGKSFSGYIGARGGGFYLYSEAGTLIGPNTAVLNDFPWRRPSEDEVADRLLFALVNECCRLFLDGAVVSVDDANLLSVALGFPAVRGGALAAVDELGIRDAVERMTLLSNMYGPQVAPSPLLEVMMQNKETFATLSTATIEVARKVATLRSRQRSSQ